ncbi:hypothetical protein WJX73_007973 [Symbiochloris irregularis]|uniref:Uncharacterized protein n=1 Tax=Symbiochloris irregularis TaxID=706552 RepID=A0AAW1NRZ7_9CHLO
MRAVHLQAQSHEPVRLQPERRQICRFSQRTERTCFLRHIRTVPTRRAGRRLACHATPTTTPRPSTAKRLLSEALGSEAAWLSMQQPFQGMPTSAAKSLLQHKTVQVLTPGQNCQAGRELVIVREGSVSADDSAAADEASGMRSSALASLQTDKGHAQALRPFLVPSPKFGVIGNSRYAKRTRRAVLDAGNDPARRPVFIFGEPGLNKDVMAALIHFGSGARSKPMARVACSRLHGEGADLFGRGNRPGLLELVGDGTLLLTNVHQASDDVKQKVVKLVQSGGQYAPMQRSQGTQPDAPSLPDQPSPRTSQARLIFTAEKRVPDIEALSQIIRIPPLRVRPADISNFQRYFIRMASERRGLKSITLTPDALRHLSAYDFPGNIKELESLVERAVGQAAGATSSPGTGTQVSEDVLWFATQQQDRYRLDLLRTFPQLRAFFRSDFFPEAINHRFTVYAFPVIVAILFLGPQDRAHNFCLNFFWDYWWAGSFLVYPFLGRVWCAVCPFMIYGEVVQRWRLAKGAVLRKWPHAASEQWGPWFLFALFAAILVWEESGVCSSRCTTYNCYKGGPAEPPDGLASAGCPLMSHPAQLTDNKNCVLCMTCLKACPHTNVQFRLRPPGMDLLTTHKPRPAEASLMFMLLGAVYLHRLPEVALQLGAPLNTPRSAHILSSVAFLAAPGVVAYAAHQACGLLNNNGSGMYLTVGSGQQAASAMRMPVGKSFVAVSYAYLPLAWGATLAHYWALLLGEGGQIVQVAAATVHLEAFGQAHLPSAEAHPAVIAFLQGSTLASSTLASLLLLRKLSAQPWNKVVPHVISMLLFSAELWYLIV